MVNRDIMIQIYHHVFLHTDSERFTFPIIGLSRLRYGGLVEDPNTSRWLSWNSVYNKYVGKIAAWRGVNIQQMVNKAVSDGIPLNVIYMKDGNPDYFDTYADELRFYRNCLVHLNKSGVSPIWKLFGFISFILWYEYYDFLTEL